MKERRNWKTWLLPGIVLAALTALVAFTAASTKIDVHLGDSSQHMRIEDLDERYMPREVLNEKLTNIQTTLKRIEGKMGD